MCIFSAVFLVEFAIMKNVPLFGDDYFFASFARFGSAEFWQAHINHYMTVHGRALVHFLVTVFLKLPHIVWQIFGAALLAFLVCLAANLFIDDGGESELGNLCAALFTAGMIFSLRIDMTHESVYWLTGSFNYVYPLVLLLLLWNLICTKRGAFLAAILPILAFFSAATTEQNAMMTVGIILIYTLEPKIFNRENKKAKRELVFALATAIVGALSVYLAPSTFIRYGHENDVGVFANMVRNISLLYFQFTFKKTNLPFIILTLLSLGAFLCIRRRGAAFKLLALGCAASVPLVIYTAVSFVGVWEYGIIDCIAFVSLIAIPSAAVVFGTLLKERPKGYLIAATALILAVGSQLMTTVSSVFGPRTMLCGVLMLTIFDLSILKIACRGKRLQAAAAILGLIFFVCGFAEAVKTYFGYKENYPINALNEAAVEEYKKDPSHELILYKLKDESYGWSMPYNSPYHLHYFKIYHGLDPSTEIKWQD